MAENVLCSVCHISGAEVACMCEYPLPLLCQMCVEKHRAMPKFHFEQKADKAAKITKESFPKAKGWLFGLDSALHTVQGIPAALHSLRDNTVSAFQVLEEQVEKLRNEYLSAIDEFLKVIEEEVEQGRREVMEKALQDRPKLETKVAEYVWKTVEETSFDPADSYTFAIRCPSEELLRRIIPLQVVTSSPLLPAFPLPEAENIQEVEDWKEEVKALRAERAAIEEDVQKLVKDKERLEATCKKIQQDLETSILDHTVRSQELSSVLESLDFARHQMEEVKSRELPVADNREPLCQTCGRPALKTDGKIWTGCRCECGACKIERITGNPKGNCDYCETPIHEEAFTYINQNFARCHVCKIAVIKEEIVTKAECIVCVRCVRVKKKSGIFRKEKSVAACLNCPKDLWFSISDAQSLEVQSDIMYLGCCYNVDFPRANWILECGHEVCKVHECSIEYCRKCHVKAIKKRR